ncbi:hypothetical protein DL96DRAFT_1686275, partial [Flagelloscypha sp. PMI_526]
MFVAFESLISVAILTLELIGMNYLGCKRNSLTSLRCGHLGRRGTLAVYAPFPPGRIIEILKPSGTTGAWLSAFLQLCSTSLESLVFEARNPPTDFQLPAGGCPSLKTVTFIIPERAEIDSDNLFLPWIHILLSQCPSLETGEIMFWLMAEEFETPQSEARDPGTLFTGLEKLNQRFPACRIVIAYPNETFPLARGVFPHFILLEMQCTYVKFWSRFYS